MKKGTMLTIAAGVVAGATTLGAIIKDSTHLKVQKKLEEMMNK